MQLQSPLGDYELVDFGDGRKLERFGHYLIERPEVRAQNPRTMKEWDPDWVYSNFAAISHWEAKKSGLTTQWSVNIDGLTQWVSLNDNGEAGISPEQILCQVWLISVFPVVTISKTSGS